LTTVTSFDSIQEEKQYLTTLPKTEKLNALLREIDSDQSGTINFEEFSVAMQMFVKRGLSALKRGNTSNIVFQKLSIQANKDEAPSKDEAEEGDEEEEEEEEEEEVPEDIASLPPDQQRTKILIRACWMMGVGTIGEYLQHSVMS